MCCFGCINFDSVTRDHTCTCRQPCQGPCYTVATQLVEHEEDIEYCQCCHTWPQRQCVCVCVFAMLTIHCHLLHFLNVRTYIHILRTLYVTFICNLLLHSVVQYMFLGADEGLYSLQLTNTSDPVMEQVYPRICHWLYIFNNVLVSISGEL